MSDFVKILVLCFEIAFYTSHMQHHVNLTLETPEFSERHETPGGVDTTPLEYFCRSFRNSLFILYGRVLVYPPQMYHRLTYISCLLSMGDLNIYLPYVKIDVFQ
jgi:hypothetical protein